MHKYILFLACMIALAGSHAAMAAEGPTGACTLITQAELDPLKLSIDGEPYEDGVNVSKGYGGAPSDIWSSICTINLGKKGAQFMSVAIHNFATPVTAAQLEAWEEETADKQEDFTGVTKSRTGDVTCEVGQYDYKPSKTSEQKTVQYYEACDELVGNRQRLVVNLQMPDDKSLLPPLEKIRGLLDIAVKHMMSHPNTIPTKPGSGQSMPAA